MDLDRRRLLRYGGACLALLVIAALVAILLPAHVVPDGGLTSNQRLERESDLRGSLLQAVAGLVVAVGAMFAAWNVVLNREANRLAERGEVTERFAKAIEHLASDRIEIRLGGIFSLRRLAADSADDAKTVTEVLSAFVRTHSHARAPNSEPPRPLRDDLLAAMSVLIDNRANTRARPNLRKIDFSQADLSNLTLIQFDMQEADFRSSSLVGCRLHNANLSRADLRQANLFAADLSWATLHRADLSDANMVQAFLSGTALDQAKMPGTILVRTDLSAVVGVMPGIGGAIYDSSTIWPEGFEPPD